MTAPIQLSTNLHKQQHRFPFGPLTCQCEDVWTSELTLLWEFVLWVTRQRCTMVPALSSRGQSSAFGKSHLNTFTLVPELNLLQHNTQSPVTIRPTQSMYQGFRDVLSTGMCTRAE